MKSWLKTIAVLFVLPIFAFFFFAYASVHESTRIRDAFVAGISKDPEISDESKASQLALVRATDFAAMCRTDPDTSARLGIAELCPEFSYFSWARLSSILLMGLGALHILLVALFAQLAKRSRQALLSSFKSAWVSSIVLSLLVLLGQTALASVTFYYVSIVVFSAYFPKLILAMLFLGAFAFYRVCRVMFQGHSPASDEPTSEEVTEQAAPVLWKRVRDIAAQVGTQVPDTLLVGMGTSFYVTELPVLHAKGVALGRTLHLSAPMMQQLSADEVSSIIGHEMGHFKGEDTTMTRKLVPQLIKSDFTLNHLLSATIVGLPAFYAMLAFRTLFETVISSYSRERELAADAWGAACTNPRTTALSLIRYCFENEVHNAAMIDHMSQGVPMVEGQAKYREQLLTHQEFWNGLMNHGLPHPFDTHPPVNLRIEKLGFSVEDLRAEAVAPVTRSAFAEWLDTNAISTAISEHENMLRGVQEAIAVKEASADELSPEVIAKHFPKIELKARPLRVALHGLPGLLILLLVAAASGRLIYSLEMPTPFYALTLILLAPGYIWLRYMSRWIGQTLTLDHRGIRLHSWKGELLFSDVEIISASNEGTIFSTLSVTFVLREARPSLEKKPVLWDRRKRVTVNLSLFTREADEFAANVARYFERGLR